MSTSIMPRSAHWPETFGVKVATNAHADISAIPTVNSPEVLALVLPQWHDAFRHFIETGEGTPEFLAYFENDARCQEAVDRIIVVQVETFRQIAAALRGAD